MNNVSAVLTSWKNKTILSHEIVQWLWTGKTQPGVKMYLFCQLFLWIENICRKLKLWLTSLKLKEASAKSPSPSSAALPFFFSLALSPCFFHLINAMASRHHGEQSRPLDKLPFAAWRDGEKNFYLVVISVGIGFSGLGLYSYELKWISQRLCRQPEIN